MNTKEIAECYADPGKLTGLTQEEQEEILLQCFRNVGGEGKESILFMAVVVLKNRI